MTAVKNVDSLITAEILSLVCLRPESWTDILTCWVSRSTFRRRVMVTVLPAAGTVELGPTGAAAATGSSPCAGRGWHRRPQGGSFCQSNGQSSSCSRRSWSHRHSPASQKQKTKQNTTVRRCLLRITVTIWNSNYHPGKENLTKKTEQREAENNEADFSKSD